MSCGELKTISYAGIIQFRFQGSAQLIQCTLSAVSGSPIASRIRQLPPTADQKLTECQQCELYQPDG